jgi:hypothetical protein
MTATARTGKEFPKNFSHSGIASRSGCELFNQNFLNMDKRLELTSEQKELAKKFNELCAEMKRAGIGFINDAFNGDVLLLNINNVEDIVDVGEIDPKDEGDKDEVLADMEEMFLTAINFSYSTGVPDSFVGVRFK